MSLAELIDRLRQVEGADMPVAAEADDNGTYRRYDVVDLYAFPAGNRYVLELKLVEEE